MRFTQAGNVLLRACFMSQKSETSTQTPFAFWVKEIEIGVVKFDANLITRFDRMLAVIFNDEAVFIPIHRINKRRASFFNNIHFKPRPLLYPA